MPDHAAGTRGDTMQHGSLIFIGDHLARSIRGLPGAPPRA
jgi:hypothetical protein